ncbi:MAG: tetratricopeptide repeat protein [Verrucomicrobiales bacterium]
MTPRALPEDTYDNLNQIAACENEEPWRQLSAAEGYAELGMFAEAHQQLDLADKYHDFRLEVAIRKLDLFLLEGRWNNAAIYGEILTDFLPEDQAPLMKYAAALHELGQTDRAIYVLSLAPEEAERDPNYQFRLAGYEMEAGSRDDALLHLENAIALEPKMRARAWADPRLRTLIAELPWESRFVYAHPGTSLRPGRIRSGADASPTEPGGAHHLELHPNDEPDSDGPF